MANHAARRRALSPQAPPSLGSPAERGSAPANAVSITNDDRKQALDFVRQVVCAALAALAILAAVQLGFSLWWVPVDSAAQPIAVSLGLAGLVGGMAATLIVGRARPLQAAAGCALAVGLYGLLQHLTMTGRSLEYLAAAIPLARHQPNIAVDVFFTNSIFHPLLTLPGLAAACLGTQFCAWALGLPHTPARPALPSVAAPRLWARILTFPLCVIGCNLVLLGMLGLIPLRGLPDIWRASPPVHISHAVLCDLIAVMASAASAYVCRGRFRLAGSELAYLVAAPLTTALAGLLIKIGNRALMIPLAALLWNSSPLEMASWGTLGAVAGYWLRDVNRVGA